MGKALFKTVLVLALTGGVVWGAAVASGLAGSQKQPLVVTSQPMRYGLSSQTTVRDIQPTAAYVNEPITPTAIVSVGVGSLTLPFTDTFDVRKRAEWRLLAGGTVVKDGQLHSVGQAILQIGDADVKNYAVEFEVGGFVNFRWGQALRASAYDQGRCWIESLKVTQWAALVEIPCWTRGGRLRIEVASGDTTTISFYDDGRKQSTVSYETTQSPGPFVLGIQGWIDNFVLSVL